LKIIINRQNPLIVEDETGYVLFAHIPIDDQELETMTLDEQDAFIQESIMDSYK
jgi:hypothetical protein